MRPLIGDLAYDAARKWRDKTALDFPGAESLSFADVDRLSGRFAGGLTALGIERGDRVVLHLCNSWQWIVAYHAIARLGAVVVPANILLAASEVSYMATDSQAVAAIVPDGAFAFTGDRPKTIIAVQNHVGVTDFDAVLEGPWLAPVAAAADDLFTIGYTSGTTGKPKGAELTQGNIFSSTSHTATMHVRTLADRVYSALPFPHVYGNVVMGALRCGRSAQNDRRRPCDAVRRRSHDVLPDARPRGD